MNNIRIRISSSIISFIIVILGFFMLCMSRAPQINIDEPLIDGGGVKTESAGDADEDLASLLNDNDESTAANTESDQASSDDDQALLSMLNQENSETDQNDQSAAVGDEGMDEILRLLEADDSTSDNESDLFASESSSTKSTTAKSDVKANQYGTTQSGPVATDDMQKEVRRLENVLASKTSEMEQLRSEVQSYDQKIAKLEARGSQSSGVTPVRYASASKRVAENRSEYAEDRTTTETERSSSTYSSGNFEAKYNAAVELYNRQEYPQAIERFYQLLQANPNHALAEHCQYWIGECRFAQGNYYQAIAEFSKVFAYETPDKQDDAQLMLGLAFLKLGQISSARSEFDWLVSCYSSSEYSKTANQYLSRF
ncbi:MAG: tetratricopeptide repeat protein [candidate division KSB1 bacterium]|nr:tetratricopeptide repeat protein [candidate division KSB1 bacterium]MDZ7318721.1 tetratricopeptide repeat protein [candidate division KSB1 bacterium]MDZ7340474.1 tetratricopeptide repeat protein [candidate division KSB1 bacterium]